MAERRAINKYYPPDWDPAKGSINTYQGSHHLRHRARRLNEGILKIRFEMPFGIICDGCNNFIAMGVRYNADKSKTGNYYSTPIYNFKMKCHLCDQWFEIETDPSKLDYKVVSGAKVQAKYKNNSDLPESERISSVENNDASKNAMSRLENRVEDELASGPSIMSVEELKNWKSNQDDHFILNQLLRKKFRNKRIQKRKDRQRLINLDKLSKLKQDELDARNLEVRKKNYMKMSIFPSKTHDELELTIKHPDITIGETSTEAQSFGSSNTGILIKRDPG